MSKRHFKPPLDKRFVGNHQGHDVYTVDAFAIRNAAQPDEEFDNVAIHDDFPGLIDPGDIWTYRKTFRREGRFFLANAIAELEALAAGMSKNEAYDAGIQAERKLRREATGIKFRNGRPHRRVPPAIYRRHFATLPDEHRPIEVWIIDGCLARCWYKTDYTEGGHGYVYPWVPKGEIWVESNIDRQELPSIIAHEYIELRLMRDRDFEYDRAHEICAEMEFDLRKAAERKEFPGLSRRRLAKRDLDKLTTAEFFEYVEANYARGVVHRIRAMASDLAATILPK